ncbi:hypothetical protein ACU4GD_26170 [Cupriavidus basilensis]
MRGRQPGDRGYERPGRPAHPAPAPTPVPLASSCTETGVDAKFACQTGVTEPLYIYQWALRQATSYFKSFPDTADGVTDLNVEEAHAAGIKGQGVNVLVLDDGVDINNEDLVANVNKSMTYNFDDGTSDPHARRYPDEHQGRAWHPCRRHHQRGAERQGRDWHRAPRHPGRRALHRHRGCRHPAGLRRRRLVPECPYHQCLIRRNPEVPDEYDTATGTSAVIRAFPNLRSGRGPGHGEGIRQ